MFQTRLLMTVACVFLTCVSQLSAEEIVLAEGGKSEYKIVVADDASPSTIHGAQELQKFLEEISGAKLPIVSDKQPQTEKEIILGDNAHLKNLSVKIDFAALGNEGYVIRTVGKTLVIAGGQLRGNMYGVYGLLEDHLGCRWFTPQLSRIPKMAKLAIPAIDDRQIPVLEYREPFTYECFDGDWCARNRMNSNAGRLEEKHGGKVCFGSGFMVHTFERLVPSQKYFDSHPEYFSLVKGKRLKEHSQLCCTNEDVIKLCTEGILKAMREQPNATVFSVSQNDWYNYCECDKCQALARQEESQIAPVLQLVNRVAEAVEKEFPDKIVETLAYQWTRKAPKQMKPRPNVVIRLCSIECCFSHPLATCDSPENQKFREDIKAWAKVAHRLWVWDYVTNFADYLLPFPNQRVRAPNINFFIEHNVKGIFEQDTYETPDSELAALGGYMTAKLLWNPKYDPDKAMNEFLEAYYGQGAGPIRKYIDLIHDYVEKHNIHMKIYFWADCKHLTDALLIEANELWQKAETAENNPEVLDRIKRSRMTVDYAIVDRAKRQVQKSLPYNAELCKLAVERYKPFCDTLQRSPLNRLHEGQRNFDKKKYCDDLGKVLSKIAK